jgi:hypothetical protein
VTGLSKVTPHQGKAAIDMPLAIDPCVEIQKGWTLGILGTSEPAKGRLRVCLVLQVSASDEVENASLVRVRNAHVLRRVRELLNHELIDLVVLCLVPGSGFGQCTLAVDMPSNQKAESKAPMFNSYLEENEVHDLLARWSAKLAQLIRRATGEYELWLRTYYDEK